MAKSLDERIAAAMGNGARAATVKELIIELGNALESSEAERAAADARANSPTTTEPEAEAAADESIKLSRRIARLSAKRDALTARLDELLTSERRKTVEAEHEAAREERDLLASDLAEQAPLALGVLVDLLTRLKANDDRCAKVNQQRAFGLPQLDSAENIARGRTGLGYHPTMMGLAIPSLKDLHIPRFHSRDWDAIGSLAWPPRDGSMNLGTVFGDCFAHLEAAAKRRAEWVMSDA